MKKLTFVVAIGLFATACGAAPNVPASEGIPTGGNQTMEGVQDQAQMVEETTNDVAGTAEATAAIGVVTQGYAEFNAHGDVSVIADDAVWIWANAGAVEGSDAIQATFQANYDSFPDIMIYPERMMSDGNVVVAQVITRGTNTGDTSEMAATGRLVGQHALHVFTIVDGEVSRAMIYDNQVTTMAQLGAIEAAAEIPVPEVPEGEPQVEVMPGAAENVTMILDFIDAAVALNTMGMNAIGAEGAVVHNFLTNELDIAWADYVSGWEARTEGYEALSLGDQLTLSFGDRWGFMSYTENSTMDGESMSVEVAHVFEFVDGQIQTAWIYGNGVALMPMGE